MNRTASPLFENADLIVVGAGFFGMTVAERAADLGFKTVVLDRRDHIGGNAHSYVDEPSGIEIHKYGPHIFHTSNAEVFAYLSKFTEWTRYEQRTWVNSRGKIYSLPINLATISAFLERHVTPAEARAWVEEQAAGVVDPQNLEDKAISLIGRPLYEAFIRGYTKKQWQVDPRLLPASIITRLPVRFTYDNRYFNDEWQCLPKLGYASLFEKMASSEKIAIYTGVDWFEARLHAPKIPVVYTGPIDRYFSYKLGRLGWRTLDFGFERHVGDFQGCSIMNYADEETPWTRITEFKHFRPERDYGHDTVIAREFSRAANEGDEPYYPVNLTADKNTYSAYAELASREPDVLFGGRLGTYRYLDMHQAVGAALKAFERSVKPRLVLGAPLEST